MPGSLVGFTDSNQKLLPASPEQSYSKAFPPSNYEMKTSKSSQLYGDDYNQGMIVTRYAQRTKIKLKLLSTRPLQRLRIYFL